MMPRVCTLVILCLTIGFAELQAQVARRGQGRADGAPLARQRLEQQVRRGFWRAAKVRIELTDEQMAKLERTTTRFDIRRRALIQDERRSRQSLRTEILAGSSANQERVAAALDRLLLVQRQRLDVQVEEQRELATFMSPVQRAKYAALQEQVRRRLEGLRQPRDSGAGPAAPE